MKTAVFVIGNRNSGKSTIIKSLTGCSKTRKRKLWDVRSLRGKKKPAFVILSSPQENTRINDNPTKFPKAQEKHFKIRRKNYDILICPLELRVSYAKHACIDYIENTLKKRFDVKLGLISRNHDNTMPKPADIKKITSYAKSHGLTIVKLDASNDPNKESSKLRGNTYPK